MLTGNSTLWKECTPPFQYPNPIHLGFHKIKNKSIKKQTKQKTKQNKYSCGYCLLINLFVWYLRRGKGECPTHGRQSVALTARRRCEREREEVCPAHRANLRYHYAMLFLWLIPFHTGGQGHCQFSLPRYHIPVLPDPFPSSSLTVDPVRYLYQ